MICATAWQAFRYPGSARTFNMRIRPFEIADAPALYRVFHSAIHKVASAHYGPEQIAAWAPDAPDPDRWTQRMIGIEPFLVEEAGKILGYADLQANGYIDHFFVSGLHPRRGIGRFLMQHLHDMARVRGIPELSADVSLSAETFFLRSGFVVVERRQAFIRGIALQNALMRKVL